MAGRDERVQRKVHVLRSCLIFSSFSFARLPTSSRVLHSKRLDRGHGRDCHGYWSLHSRVRTRRSIRQLLGASLVLSVGCSLCLSMRSRCCRWLALRCRMREAAEQGCLEWPEEIPTLWNRVNGVGPCIECGSHGPHVLARVALAAAVVCSTCSTCSSRGGTFF